MRITRIFTKHSINYLIEINEKRLLVDCSCDLEELEKLTSSLDAIVLSHGHFDHFFSLEQVQKRYGCAVYMHKNAIAKLSDARLNASKYFSMPVECNLAKQDCVFIKEGKQKIADVPVEIFFAPGHTDDSILLLICNVLFVGDFVFENTYGRTDLPTGNFVHMQNSLKKYKKLISECVVCSGH